MKLGEGQGTLTIHIWDPETDEALTPAAAALYGRTILMEEVATVEHMGHACMFVYRLSVFWMFLTGYINPGFISFNN